MAVVLVISLLPASFANTVSAAQAGTFIFPNEQYDVNSARLVNEDRVSLTGTLNGVNDKQISYSVFQLTKKRMARFPSSIRMKDKPATSSSTTAKSRCPTSSFFRIEPDYV
ncbi:hypothetical protein VQ056_25630 [Paenibacillus sp. JTLBN-2024]